METKNRENRRRKIVERGSDRLALITGRIPSIPSPSSPSPLHHEAFTDSSQPLFSHDQDLPDKITVSPDDGDKTSGSVLQKENPISDAKQTLQSSANSPLRKFGMSTETITTPASEAGDKILSSLVSSIDQNPSISNSAMEQVLEPRTFQPIFFTPNQISAAIAASEHTRLLCSVTVALLVVLSYLGFPLLGSTAIKSIISFRPLMLLLLTNLTVVLGRLLLDNEGSRRAIRGESKSPSVNGQDLAVQLGNALEIGLVMKKIMDAVFMDFSVYAIIITCGLSFAQQFS